MKKKTARLPLSDRIERKFNSLPAYLKVTSLLYLLLITLFVGVVAGLIINSGNLSEIHKSQKEKTFLEYKALTDILERANSLK